ncbi:MAG: helix-turn-helix domain-containing protein [Sarcina sp.]
MLNTLEIGKNIFRLRKDKGITQEELSKVVGVSVAAVSKWEGGATYPDITLLPSIANFFNVSIDELMSYQNNISDEEIEEISARCIDAFDDEGEESGISICNKYIRKYTKAYKLKNFLAGLIVMKSSIIKDKEKQRKNYARALSICEDVINNSNDDELIKTGIIMVGNINMVLEDYDKALEIYGKVKQDNFGIANMIGNAHIKKGNIKKGREVIQTNMIMTIANLESAITGLASSYKDEDMNIAKKYLKLRRDIMNILEREVDFADYMFELELLTNSSDEEEKASALKKTLLEIEQVNFDFEKIKEQYNKWYLDSIEIKEKKSTFPVKFNFKKMLIDSIKSESKYEQLLERKDIAEIIERIK